MRNGKTIAVVIPSYEVTAQIQAVIANIGPDVDRIYVVDDACPDGSGRLVQSRVANARVQV